MIKFNQQAKNISYADIVKISEDYGCLLHTENPIYIALSNMFKGLINNEVISYLLNLKPGTKGVMLIAKTIIMLDVKQNSIAILVARRLECNNYAVTKRAILRG